jgi:hypothetical protein
MKVPTTFCFSLSVILFRIIRGKKVSRLYLQPILPPQQRQHLSAFQFSAFQLFSFEPLNP